MAGFQISSPASPLPEPSSYISGGRHRVALEAAPVARAGRMNGLRWLSMLIIAAPATCGV